MSCELQTVPNRSSGGAQGPASVRVFSHPAVADCGGSVVGEGSGGSMRVSKGSFRDLAQAAMEKKPLLDM